MRVIGQKVRNVADIWPKKAIKSTFLAIKPSTYINNLKPEKNVQIHLLTLAYTLTLTPELSFARSLASQSQCRQNGIRRICH